MAALFQEQLRDPRTGRLSQSKWAKPVHGAGMRDFLRAHTRLLYALANGDPQVAAQLALAVARTGDYFGSHVDDKPAATGPRVTIFNVAPGAPSAEVPPPQGQLTQAEGPYEEVREEDAP